MSTTDAKSAMSLSPTKAAALLFTNVDTKTFGRPIGKERILADAIVLPPLPPRAKTPSKAPL